MARHASPRPSRALLRTGLTLAAVGAALTAGASAASAAQAAPLPLGDVVGGGDALGGAAQGLRSAVKHGLGGATNLQLDPLAGTGSDPLDNAVGTQVADFKPVSTALVTKPITDGASLSELPLLGPVTKALTG